MRRKGTLITLLVALICFSATTFAGIDSPDTAFTLIQQQVLKDSASNLPVYGSKAIVPAGTLIKTFKGPFMTVDEASWIFFIDLHPGANWEHPCQYVFINPETEAVKIVDAVRPPESLKDMTLFQGIDILGGKNLRPVRAKKPNNSRSAEHLWAVILSGGASSGSNHVRYWNDCSSIYQTLTTTYGYLDDHIIVAISDGLDPAPDQSNGQNSDPDLDGDGDDDIMYSCINTNLETIFDDLAATLGSQDTLFVFTTDHGSGQSGVPGQPTSMNLWNSEEIWDYEFAALLEPIQCREMIFTMEPCFSGGFVNDIIDMNSTVPRVITTAANDHEYSWAMPPDYVYDTYVFHWTAAITGADAYGNPVDADTNMDGEVTMDEAYAYALDMDEDDEHPQYGEWPAGYGAGLTMAGSGPVSEGAVNLSRTEYNCDDTIMVIVEDLDLVGAGSQTVTITSTSETVAEVMTLIEVDDGRFEGTIDTATGTPASDGILQVTANDTITVTYLDGDFGGAGPMTLTDTANVDCTGPVISNVAITNISEAGFTVTWDTDESCDSTVNFGDTMSLGNIVEDTELVTSHSITVAGVEDCTTYYFEVQSMDNASNLTIDDNGGMYFDLLTLELVTMLEANMDVDPGWAYEGMWAYGIPEGNEGDPTSGYTGENVVGYNLAGDYTNNMSETHCTTAAFDCSEASQVYLNFWKWLGMESATYDHATIYVSGDNGSSWDEIWTHTDSSGTPTNWSFVEYDISNTAAGQSQVLVRWTMGETDSSVTYCGWNIDDVRVSYTQECTTNCNNDGDVTLDDTITAGDAQMAFMIALGTHTPSWDEECAADCTGDGSVTAGDAQAVFMAALGTGTCADPM